MLRGAQDMPPDAREWLEMRGRPCLLADAVTSWGSRSSSFGAVFAALGGAARRRCSSAATCRPRSAAIRRAPAAAAAVAQTGGSASPQPLH